VIFPARGFFTLSIFPLTSTSMLLQKSSCPGSSQADQHYSAANGFLQGHERFLKNAAGVEIVENILT